MAASDPAQSRAFLLYRNNYSRFATCRFLPSAPNTYSGRKQLGNSQQCELYAILCDNDVRIGKSVSRQRGRSAQACLAFGGKCCKR